MSVRGMDAAKQAQGGPKVARRHLLLGTAAAVLIAAAGGGYYLWSRPQSSILPPAAADSSVSMGELMLPGPLGDESLGAADAPVVIVEYASMTCPHCAHFHETTFPELKKRYIDTGKVRFIFREFPLDPLAAAGSMLARCAGKDKYFPMLETLFAQQKEWVVQKPLEPLLGIAKQAGFTQQSFDQCLANQQLLDGIEQSRARGTKLGVSSTPTFFINGNIVRGVLTVEELEKQVAPFLKS
jgi:protein-disulfide isomerase